MSSLNLPTCAFCTFTNEPNSKICIICKKSLDLPAVSTTTFSELKMCPICTFSNETSNNICQMCGTVLAILPTSTQGTLTCLMCGKNIGENRVKVCRACTYHNQESAAKCLMCDKRFKSSEKAILSKMCPSCNHDNTDIECTGCTFKNSLEAVNCVMCEQPLKYSIVEDEDFSDNDNVPMEEGPMDTDSDIVDVEPIDQEPIENISIGNDSVEDVVDVMSTNTVGSTSTPTVDDKIPEYQVSFGSFEMLETAPQTHKYFNEQRKSNTAKFLRSVASNIEILKKSLPTLPGVWVKTYENRMDLMTFMIEGPRGTPYENGLFLFDIQLPSDFPSKPPQAHYISFCDYRLNPNLYVDGKVCVSLLGTWEAQRKEEKWGPKSTLLQLIVSIQGLILVEQPYFNEPGFVSTFGTKEGNERSARYNEKLVLRMLHSTKALINNPPPVFEKEIFSHFSKCGLKMYERFKEASNSIKQPDRPSPTTLENFRLAMENICKRIVN